MPLTSDLDRPPMAHDIHQAGLADVAPACAMLSRAFAADPLMHYFFSTYPAGVPAGAGRFFSLLMRARLALGMPVLVMKEGGAPVGLAMGYRPAYPEWPQAIGDEWTAFEAEVPGVAARFAEYEAISAAGQPAVPHYYLGVIGVDESRKGTGQGGRMLNAFSALSDADPTSRGVYLETGNPRNVGFYARHGFEVRHEAPLVEGRLWCMFRPTPAA